MNKTNVLKTTFINLLVLLVACCSLMFMACENDDDTYSKLSATGEEISLEDGSTSWEDIRGKAYTSKIGKEATIKFFCPREGNLNSGSYTLTGAIVGKTLSEVGKSIPTAAEFPRLGQSSKTVDHWFLTYDDVKYTFTNNTIVPDTQFSVYVVYKS